MILSGQQINDQSNVSQNKLVDPFNLNNLKRSSYDLTIGDEYYCGSNAGKISTSLETKNLAPNQTLSIPAHGVCFILCSETITLPDDISARVALRMSLIYQGLVLTAQPPFDPGYRGKVIVMLHNLSSNPVSIKQGDRLATIEFIKVDGKTTSQTIHQSVSSLAQQLRSPLMGSLTEIDERVKEANKKVNWIIGQFGTIVAALIAIPAITGFVSYSVLAEKISDLKTHIAMLEQVNDEQKRIISELKSSISFGKGSKKAAPFQKSENN